MPGQPDSIARALGLAGLLLAIVNLIWIWTRSRRKLTIEAGFIWPAPDVPDGPLAISAVIRNPRKVSIGLTTVGIKVLDQKGNQRTTTKNLIRSPPGATSFEEIVRGRQPEILPEGDESIHTFVIPPDVEEVADVFAIDTKGRIWSTSRISDRSRFREWRKRQGGIPPAG